MSHPNSLNELTEAVVSGSRYADVSLDLIHWVCEREIPKGRKIKESVRAVRSKLHQVAGAYLEHTPDYMDWITELGGIPHHMSDLTLQEFCRRKMACHASTQERLPFLEEFYARIFTQLPPVQSILDLACGFNPMALPWMPIGHGAVYYACDIYQGMTDFLDFDIITLMQ